MVKKIPIPIGIPKELKIPVGIPIGIENSYRNS